MQRTPNPVWLLAPPAFSSFVAFYYVEGNSLPSWIARVIVFALPMGWALWHWRRIKRQHG